MGYRDIINNLKPIEYSKYKDITSYEKLMIYVAKVLEDKSVPLTFNYLCISAFKMFPDAFCCDEEFKEFPSVDRLNRTYMHLKYVKKGQSYITGTTKEGYKLTIYGRSIAEEVNAILLNTKVDKSISAPPVDTYKKGFSKDYIMFKKSEGYKDFEETKRIDLMYIWEFFNVTPYSRLKMINSYLKDILQYAKDSNDEECMEYVNEIINILK